MADKPKLGKNTGNAGKGRPKGVPNKATATLKDMILTALDKAHPNGGAEYLKEQAEKNPAAFMTLIGKVLPLQVSGEMEHRVKVSGALAWKQPQ